MGLRGWGWALGVLEAEIAWRYSAIVQGIGLGSWRGGAVVREDGRIRGDRVQVWGAGGGGQCLRDGAEGGVCVL